MSTSECDIAAVRICSNVQNSAVHSLVISLMMTAWPDISFFLNCAHSTNYRVGLFRIGFLFRSDNLIWVGSCDPFACVCSCLHYLSHCQIISIFPFKKPVKKHGNSTLPETILPDFHLTVTPWSHHLLTLEVMGLVLFILLDSSVSVHFLYNIRALLYKEIGNTNRPFWGQQSFCKIRFPFCS